MHSKDRLAAELNKAGLGDMAIRAASGYYHDFLSYLDTPCIQLAADLAEVGTPEALALRDRHINGEFDATKEESDAWFNGPEGVAAQEALADSTLKRKAARQSPFSKPARAIKPDAQGFDRVEIVTVPRYKESELSGDEWRISAAIIFYRKGKEVHRAGYRNIETACGHAFAEHSRAHDDGKAFFAGEGDVCDQEGCASRASWRHELKQKFDRSTGTPTRLSQGGEFRLFCDMHKTRGNCGFEDSDSNYIVTPLPPPPSGETTSE